MVMVTITIIVVIVLMYKYVYMYVYMYMYMEVVDVLSVRGRDLRGWAVGAGVQLLRVRERARGEGAA